VRLADEPSTALEVFDATQTTDAGWDPAALAAVDVVR
jgi:hypothetical protein